jgi:multidrug efflux system membrane fusion protein
VGKLLQRLFALVITLGAAAAIIYVSALPSIQKQGGRRANMANGAVPVLAAQARVTDVPVYLDGVGTAKARNTVTVRPQVDGRILSINFKEGQEVKQGEVLAKIDPSTYQAQLDQAIAKKALDEAQLANAERDLERYTKLGGNIIAQKTIDTQRALVEQLVAQIKLDEAAIANAKAFLNYTTIVSPLNGRTGIRMVDEGNLVRATDAGIVMITELRPISVLFTLPQQELAQINRALATSGSLKVEARDANGKTTLDAGTLKVVDNQVDQATGTVRMKAEFANSNMQLWPGQFVNVRVHVDTLKQVVVIPTPAVQRGPNGTFAYVVQADDVVGLRPIRVSHQTSTDAVIDSGIVNGEQVVTTGFARLKDGARVAVAPAEGNKEAPPPPGAQSNRGGRTRTACAEDFKKFCANVEQNRDAMRSCLQANAAQLSEGCRSAITEAADRRRNRGAPKEGTATE